MCTNCFHLSKQKKANSLPNRTTMFSNSLHDCNKQNSLFASDSGSDILQRRTPFQLTSPSSDCHIYCGNRMANIQCDDNVNDAAMMSDDFRQMHVSHVTRANKWCVRVCVLGLVGVV